MTIRNADIEVGLIVRHRLNSGVFWVTEITPSGDLTLSLTDFTNGRTISQRVLINGYQRLPEDGFLAQKFLDPNLVSSWVYEAPLKLLSAVMRDGDSSGTTERDFKKILYAGPKDSPIRLIKDLTWNDWWGRTEQLLRENQSHFRLSSNSWGLTQSSTPLPEIPLPSPIPKPTELVSSKPIVRPLSIDVTSIISGDLAFKDLSDNQRQNVTRRLLEDGIWWWFKRPDGITQVLQYERSLAELLNHLSQPDCPNEHRELLADIIPKLSSRGASGKLKKVLEALEKLPAGDDSEFSGIGCFTQKLVPILVQTSLRIRNEKDRDQADAMVAEVAIAKLINRWSPYGDELKSYLEHYDKLSPGLKEMVHLGQLDLAIAQELARVELDGPRKDEVVNEYIEEWKRENPIIDSTKTPTNSIRAYQEIVSTLVSSVLSAVENDTRIAITLNLLASSATRDAVLKFLTRASITPDTVSFLLSCIRRALVESDMESLQGLSVAAGDFCERLDDSYSEQIVAMWMGMAAAGIQVTNFLATKMESQISQHVAGSDEKSLKGASPINQVLKVFGAKARKRQRAAEGRFRKELLNSQDAQEQLRNKVKDAEAELAASKQLVERVRSGQKTPERRAEFYGKTSILEPLVDYLQQLILYETQSSEKDNKPSNVVIRLMDILAVAGVRKVQEIGEFSDYQPTLHQFAPDSSTFNSPVIILCSGFFLEDPDGNETILKRAIVRGTK